MNIIDALNTVQERVVARAGGTEDDELLAAWRLVVAAAVPGAPGLPPSALGRLYDGALKLAQQVKETAAAGEWETPPANSQAMERLIHRLTLLLEILLDVHEEARLREAAQLGRRAVATAGPVDEQHVPWSGGDVDWSEAEASLGYCDDCGAPLRPDGHCTSDNCPTNTDNPF